MLRIGSHGSQGTEVRQGVIMCSYDSENQSVLLDFSSSFRTPGDILLILLTAFTVHLLWVPKADGRTVFHKAYAECLLLIRVT